MSSGFRRLQRKLNAFDVYVISTSAMISSGFFLLPGVAVGITGSSAVIAYFAAGVLMVPALLSQAELATAMPRAGGAYYFLDRTLGPLVGVVGGVGTWITLVLKSAFALIGMGAYLALAVDLPVRATAVAFTVAFCVLNVVGSRESSRLLRWLLAALMALLLLFILHGFSDILGGRTGPSDRIPLLPNGMDGFLETVGLVFVSFIGLTKVASLAEEVTEPDRNIPAGMALALGTVTLIYVAGVFIMVRVLDGATLAASLTPVADTAGQFSSWMPGNTERTLMVIAAVAAFASMSNAGIMAASRYPLAMGRDGLFPARFATTGKSNTPTQAIALTGLLLVIALLTLDIEQVAKMASATQLLLFALINVAVIVMRESRIESYDPGFRSPLYPWMQLAGIFVPLILVAEMGWLPVLFTVGVTAACFGWYTNYARDKIKRDGAIYHVFQRLGQRRYSGLDRELRDIMKEKGARAEDPFDEVVAGSRVLDLAETVQLPEIVRQASSLLAQVLPVTAGALDEAFGRGIELGGTPVAHGAALLHTRLPDLQRSEMIVVRCRDGVSIPSDITGIAIDGSDQPIRAIFFLVSDSKDPGKHLRILAHLAGRVEDEQFIAQWLGSHDDQDLKEVLLRDDRFLSLRLKPGSTAATLIGRSLRELDMPEGCLVALINRGGESIVPRGSTILRPHDRLTVIGQSEDLRAYQARYADGR